MSGIKDIIKSWWTSFGPTEEQSKEAERRLAICMKPCEHRRESVVFGYTCGMCGCPLGKKIFSSDPKPCPDNRW
jgi:hypothetical protein